MFNKSAHNCTGNRLTEANTALVWSDEDTLRIPPYVRKSTVPGWDLIDSPAREVICISDTWSYGRTGLFLYTGAARSSNCVYMSCVCVFLDFTPTSVVLLQSAHLLWSIHICWTFPEHRQQQLRTYPVHTNSHGLHLIHSIDPDSVSNRSHLHPPNILRGKKDPSQNLITNMMRKIQYVAWESSNY